MLKTVSTSSAPQFLTTLYCRRCGYESSFMNTDIAKCYQCKKSDELIELEREKLTQQVMTNRMQKVTDRLMDNLVQAYDNSRYMLKDHPEDEMLILEALAKGQELQETIEKL